MGNASSSEVRPSLLLPSIRHIVSTGLEKGSGCLGAQESTVSDTGIVTVATPGRICRDQADGSPCIPEDALLQKLKQLPQVQQAIHNKSADDQVWRDLAAYSQGQFS